MAVVLSVGTERDIRTADRERTGVQIGNVVSNAGTLYVFDAFVCIMAEFLLKESIMRNWCWYTCMKPYVI